MLGGIYQQDNQVLVGPLVRQAVSNFCVNVFFVGTDGFSEKNGFTNRDHLRAEAVRDMAGQAESVVIVTESEKFRRAGVVPLNLGDSVKMVITDSNIPDSARKSLESKSIEVVTAELD